MRQRKLCFNTQLLWASFFILSTAQLAEATWPQSHDLPNRWNMYIGPVVADLDRTVNNTDGGKAVISWSETNLIIYKSDGSSYATASAPTGFKLTAAPAVGDVDSQVSYGGDEYPEIVGVMDKWNGENWVGRLRGWNYLGTHSITDQEIVGYIFSSVTLFDFDEDGDNEVIVTRLQASGNDFELESVRFFEVIWYMSQVIFNSHGTMGTQSTPLPWSGTSRFRSPCIGDMDRNGDVEVIMFTDTDLRLREMLDWGTYTPDWNSETAVDKTISDFLPQGASGKFSPMGCALADVDDDGNLELLVTVEDETNNLCLLKYMEKEGPLAPLIP